MADVLNSIVVSLGTSAADASTSNRATDWPYPFVSWEVPPGFSQRRFSILISNADGATAYTTSGPVESRERYFQFPDGVALNDNFTGLCKIEVALSEAMNGDFEKVSQPYYFVFDRNLERFYNANQIQVAWQASSDPDNQPTGGLRSFQLEIATDPLFANQVYLGDLVNEASPTPSIAIAPSSFVPQPDRYYFCRVRQFDGLDWGDWSKVNAFISRSNTPPTMQINSVVPTSNGYGDITITFTVSDADSEQVAVNLWYTSTDNLEPTPLRLINSTALFPPGQHRVTWRSNQDVPFQRKTGVLIYGQPSDESGSGPQTWYGPVTVDNTHIALPGGGVGATNYSYPVTASIAKLTESTLGDSTYPAEAMQVATDVVKHAKAIVPAHGDQFVQPNIFTLGRLESSPEELGTPRPGWPNTTVPPQYDWPRYISACWSGTITSLTDYAAISFPAGGGRRNPHATSSKFLFSSPVAYAAFSDAWPRPFASSRLPRQRYLRGFFDTDGLAKDYPDAYDWDNRPAWHADQEIWDTGDAWIQVAHVSLADHPVCATCAGRNWVPSGTGPYSRSACTNPSCNDGFDTSVPGEFHDGRSKLKAFIKPVWYRLSSLMMQRPYLHEDRTGMPVPTPPSYTVAWKQHVVGRHLSTLDTLQGRHAEWPADESLNITAVTRQPGEGVDVPGFITKEGVADTDLGATLPVVGATNASSAFDGGNGLPAQGEHGPLKQTFFWGVDPDSNAGHQNRPTPSQFDNIRVGGAIGRIWQTYPLSFRFLQPYWDSYNTIHWRATGSETSMYHVQVARIANGVTGTWQDTQGDNAVFSEAAGRHLIPALTFHMFWDTSRALFAVDSQYRMRLRLYDAVARAFSEWAYSPIFRLIEDVPNPVSVLSTVYEPWNKWVEISLRVDDTESDSYDLTKFWYSRDDGETWLEINGGDIAGETVALSSDRSGSDNVHTIYWRASGYGLPPGDEYRIKIQARPTKLNELVSPPFFRWYTQINPVMDPAENEIASYLGRRDSFTYDETQAAWLPLETPVFTPGQIDLLTRERDRVRDHPSPSEGWYSFHNESGEVIDQTGLDQWLLSRYAGTESHGMALNRIAIALDNIWRVNLPAAYEKVFAAEMYCRKNLIGQGYYAESHFNEADGEVDETVTVHPIINVDTESVVDVLRYWRFRVQSRPEGPADIYDESGYLNPIDITTLEQAFCKIQIDSASTFDSQPHGLPMREVVRNYDGARLSTAQFDPGALIADVNPAVDGPSESAEQIWSDTTRSGERITDVTSPSPAVTVTLGGSLKLTPASLPGEVESDTLPDGKDNWNGNYYWRVCSYNVVHGPVLARPRPLITGLTEMAANDIWKIEYRMQAHSHITHASIAHTDNEWGAAVATGYQFSVAYTTPTWTDIQPINYVSDRRQPLDTEATIPNQFPWVPRGTDRPRPCVLYDDDLMQYVMVTAKKHYSGNWRVISSRSMCLPDACEYEAYWDGRPEVAIYAPWIIKDGDRFAMYVTTQGDTPSLKRSTSSDADSWTSPAPLVGIGAAAHPCVVLVDGTYHLWYEASSSGRVRIFYATSTDGLNFTMANGGNAVYSGSGDVGSPSVVRLNGSWIMYLNDLSNDCIVSLYSSNGTSWQGYKVELMPGTVQIDGTPTMATPRHPCAFVDRYRGNNELFMMFNYVLPSGEARVYTSRLEDRLWVTGQPGKLYGAAGHLVDVPSSRDGVDRQISIGMSANGIVGGSSLKVRLNFSEFDPANREFHRQSEWVSPTNSTQYGAVLDPDPWYYDAALKSVPYLEMA